MSVDWISPSFVSLLVEALGEVLDQAFVQLLVLCFVDIRESFLDLHSHIFPSHTM